jgi:hypothetical protein
MPRNQRPTAVVLPEAYTELRMEKRHEECSSLMSW